MKKITIILALIAVMLAFNSEINAQDTMWIYRNDQVYAQKATNEIDSLTFQTEAGQMLMYSSAESTTFTIDDIDYITFGSQPSIDSNAVYIVYNADTAYVYSYNGDISYETIGANVSITTETENNVSYYVSGTSSNGSLLIESNEAGFDLYLNNVELTSLETIPIKLSKKKAVNIYVEGVNTLTDNAASDGKAVINSKGVATFLGSGSLTINANKKNGISSDNGIIISDGTIIIDNPVDASKGLKCDKDIEISGGNLIVNASGSIVFDTFDLGYDPYYCTAIGADGNVIMTGGDVNITIPSSNAGGRGIKADGSITISGGSLGVTSEGTGATYTDTTGTIDSYSSSCLKADNDINLLGGNITIVASGVGGKGINADSLIVIGEENADNTNLYLTVSTSGAKFYVSGYGDDADYANPKAVKAGGNLYLYSGILTINTSQDGAEGLESKDTLFINGGENTINTYDDAINASNAIVINGGTTYAHATNNDGIDANGTLTINGGLTIAVGTRAPEEGFDCDQNDFTITGGTIVGIGGSTSTPTSSLCTQNSLIYSSLTSGSTVNITSSDGDNLLTFQIPTISNQGGGPGGWKSGSATLKPGPGGNPGGQGGNGLTLLFSSPDLTNGTYTITTGGTISGGTEFGGYYTGATYSGGSSTSVTISSKVTTAQ